MMKLGVAIGRKGVSRRRRGDGSDGEEDWVCIMKRLFLRTNCLLILLPETGKAGGNRNSTVVTIT